MSSESESDDDYVPVEQEKLSEEESADEETEQQYDNEVETVKKKRKRPPPSKGNKRSKVIEQKSDDETTVLETNIVKPEEEKKREEDLWAQFLEGTDSKPKSKTEEIVTQPEKVVQKDSIESKKSDTSSSQSDNEREKRIFEFAGETIVVENNVIKERVKTAEKPASVLNDSPAPKARSAGGLSSIVGQLNKKNKLSTLEKSKLDWNTYKREEGIEEEITSHNKGKSGYLDRQDFLSRADVRQYEIERDLRMSRRSNR